MTAPLLIARATDETKLVKVRQRNSAEILVLLRAIIGLLKKPLSVCQSD